MPEQKIDLFVDTHVHFFNLVDVPVYEPLDGQVRMTLAKMLAAFSATGAFISGLVRSKVHEYKNLGFEHNP